MSASNSWQGLSYSAISLEEGNVKNDGPDYGGQDLVRVRDGDRHAETAETIWHGEPMLVQHRMDPMVRQLCVEL